MVDMASAIATPLSDVVSCSPSEDLLPVVRQMAGSIDHRALVLDGDRLVGIISPSDITCAHEHNRLARP